LAKPGQYSNEKPKEMSKKRVIVFKYGIAKLYLIFPIVRIFQITRKLVHNDLFVNARSRRNRTKFKKIICHNYRGILFDQKISISFKLKNLMKTVEFRPLGDL
jgi:hypothetical protein